MANTAAEFTNVSSVLRVPQVDPAVTLMTPAADRLAPPIEVCITADVEFSIGGAFTFPLERVPVGRRAVDCDIDGVSHGLDFILRVLEEHGIGGTFFVEALQTAYFGDAPMRDVARSIVSRGHDVQLHIHPEWTYFRDADWKMRIGRERPNPSCASRSVAEIGALLRAGIDTFQRWGLPKPLALRTGSFLTDRNVYEAMIQNGIRIGSNVGLGYAEPNEASLHLFAGLHHQGAAVEIPATTYRGNPLSRGWRVLTIASASEWETQSILERAYQLQLSPIVIVTHPFEFIKRRDAQFRKIRRNRTTQNRFVDLCRYLRDNPARFQPVQFSHRAAEWPTRPDTANPLITASPGAVFSRAIQNKVNDLIWYY